MNFSVRRDDRHRIAADIRVTTTAGAAIALTLIDLSRSGIGTDGLVQFDAGTALHVLFPDGTILAGRSMWREDFSAGILFDEPLDPAALTALLAALTRTPVFR